MLATKKFILAMIDFLSSDLSRAKTVLTHHCLSGSSGKRQNRPTDGVGTLPPLGADFKTYLDQNTPHLFSSVASKS